MNTLSKASQAGVKTLSRPSTTMYSRSKSSLTQVFSEKAIHPIGPFYSQAIKANGFVFLSMQLPADQQCKLVGGSIAEQTHKMIQNAGHVLEAAGTDLEKVVKVNICLKDLTKVGELNKVYTEYFPQRPARTVTQVTAILAGAEMSMDLVAVVE